MASLSMRNLDDDLLGRLKRRAARRGRSAEAEVRDILRQASNGEAEVGFDVLAADFARSPRSDRTPLQRNCFAKAARPVKTFVIDASGVIKWVIEEPGTKEALGLRRHRLLAPDLLILE